MATSASPQTGIYTQQHSGRGTTMIVDNDGIVDITSGTLRLPTAQRAKYVPLGSFLFNARELASAETISSGTTAPAYFFGGLLLTDTTPALALTASGDQSFYLNYASAVVDGIKLPPIALPSDLSTADGLTIELKGESVGTATAADAKSAFDIRAWVDVGDTEMGSTHPDFSSTPSWQGVTLASGDIASGGTLNLTLVPQAHAGRAIRLYDARMRYTAKTS